MIKDDYVLYTCFICSQQKEIMLQIIKQNTNQTIDTIKLGRCKEMFLCFGCLINTVLKLNKEVDFTPED